MKYLKFVAVFGMLLLSWSLPAIGQSPSSIGQWVNGPVWDISPVHMMVLPNGKVMFFPGSTISGNDPRVWDPVSGTLTQLAKPGFDIFCSGMGYMPDGTLLIAGGNADAETFTGLPNASVYNYVNNNWIPAPNMNAARWYPTATTLGLGDVLVQGGFIDNITGTNDLPQVWQKGTGTWRNLSSAVMHDWTYPWTFLTPFGNVIVAGPGVDTRYLTTSGTGAWTHLAYTDFPTRDYGSAVMYDDWHILILGGGQPPMKTAEVLSLGDPTPAWRPTQSMTFARRQINATLLADGTVLATGGTSGNGFNDTTQPVYASELWDPDTETWTTMASQTVGRFYHSVAVLLPDGRVLSGGGDNVHQTEIYSPPYLFKGARPTITSAPTQVSYSDTFFVGTPDAASIGWVNWIRLPSVTHAFDMNQRINRLSFAQANGGINVTAPGSQYRTPPGHYMLFLLNAAGVPSVAKIIQIVQ